MKSISNLTLKKRVLWIDIARAIGIQFVLIGHLTNPIQPFIFSWHMPFFFIISGLVIDTRSNLKATIVKDFRSLIFPFIIFSFVALIIELPKRLVLNREPLNYTEQVKNILIWWDYDSLVGTYAFVLWFLPALFFAKLFTIVLLKFIRLQVCHVAVLMLCFLTGYNFDLIFSLDEALTATPFVYVGHRLFKLLTKEHFIHKTKIPIFVLSIFATCFFLQLGVPELDFAIKEFRPLIYSIIWSILISIIIFFICLSLTAFYRFFILFINGAMTFYIMHPYTHNIADQLRQFLEIHSWIFTYLVSLSFLLALDVIYNRVKVTISNVTKN